MAILLNLLLLFCCFNEAISQECSDSEVLILGGGMTGVSAANKLNELGINFIILEAQDELGGRLKTAEIAPGVSVNVGANWIQGVDRTQPRLHPLFDLAERCGGLEGIYSDFDNIIIYNSQGNEISDGALRYDDFESATEAASDYSSSAQDNGDPDISFREGLTQAGWEPRSPEDNFVEWFEFDFCFAERPNVSSLFSNIDHPTYSDFLANPDNEGEDYYITDSRGFPALIKCLANNFSANINTDERIHLETEVTLIENSEDCVCVTANENGGVSRYCAPYAIITFSVGVLENGSATLFSPPLPTAKVNALQFIVNAFYLIIYSRFTERFWDEYQFIGHVHPERGYFPIIQILPQSFGVNATAVHVVDDLAYRLASLSEDALKAEVTQVFRNIYGDGVPEPTQIVSMPWGTDPHFLGSYSNIRPGGGGMLEELRRPEGRMYLAGEGTNTYSGFVHGAFLSGIDTANAVMQQLSSGPPTVSSGSNVLGNIMLVLLILAVINYLQIE